MLKRLDVAVRKDLQWIVYSSLTLLKYNFPMDANVRPLVSWLVWWSVCHNSHKYCEVKIPCSYGKQLIYAKTASRYISLFWFIQIKHFWSIFNNIISNDMHTYHKATNWKSFNIFHTHRAVWRMKLEIIALASEDIFIYFSVFYDLDMPSKILEEQTLLNHTIYYYLSYIWPLRIYLPPLAHTDP